MVCRARNRGNLGDTGGFRGLVNCSGGLKLKKMVVVILTVLNIIINSYVNSVYPDETARNVSTVKPV